MPSSSPLSSLTQITIMADLDADMRAPPDGHAGNTNGHEVATSPAHAVHAAPGHGTSASAQAAMDMAEWDMMFDAVQARLAHTVGRLGELPNTPQHSAELSASLVQAVVLECVAEMDKLHADLKRKRSQRLTA